MSSCKAIVWVNFPYTNLDSTKHRPALVISSGGRYGDYICLPISHTKRDNSVKLASNDFTDKLDLRAVSLVTTSYLVYDKPMTIDQAAFDKKRPPLGTLKEVSFNKIIENLTKSIVC